MPANAVNLVSTSLAMYAKDLRLELRTRYAVNAILMFGITTLAVVSFSLGQSGLPPDLLAALFWIVVFFSAVSGLAHSFIREEEAQTALALKLAADPVTVYVGKLLFNLSLLSLMTLIITPIFFIFTDAPTENVMVFLLLVIFGVLGLCAATTLVAAIVAKAAVKGALFAVISFPLLIILLMVLVGASEKVLAGQGIGEITQELQVLVAYPIIMVTASLMLFKFVWQE